MAKDRIYETRRMRSNGAYHHFFKESGSDAWRYHNWDGPAIEPIEDEDSKYKKEYYLYGRQLTILEWEEARKNREGLPWYKNPAMKGTTRF
jgi:hypothetical protein